MIPALLHDAWRWCASCPHFAIGLVVGALAQLGVYELLKLIILRDRD